VLLINVKSKHKERLIFDLLSVKFSALHGFVESPIAFISHERKQVFIQFLNNYWIPDIYFV